MGDRQWYANRREDDWTFAEGPFDSEAEAIGAGGDLDLDRGDGYYTGFKSPFEPYVSGEDFRDRIAEQAWDQAGEHAGDWPAATKSQTDQLGERLKRVFLSWLAEIGQEPGFFAIDGIERHVWNPDAQSVPEPSPRLPPGPPPVPMPRCRRCGEPFKSHDRFGDREGCPGYSDGIAR